MITCYPLKERTSGHIRFENYADSLRRIMRLPESYMWNMYEDDIYFCTMIRLKGGVMITFADCRAQWIAEGGIGSAEWTPEEILRREG